MFLMRAYPLQGQVGEGWAPWKSRVFWALGNGNEPIGESHLGPKKLTAPPPHPELIRNQQETLRCIKEHSDA